MAMATFVEKAVSVSLAEAVPDVFRWCGRDLVRRVLLAETRMYWSWVLDEMRARSFQTAMNIPNTHLHHFQCKLVSTGAGEALIGVRFRSGDADDAFVQVYARDFEIAERQALSPFLAKCLDEFEIFKPKAVRVRVPPSVDLGSVSEKVDFITLAGSIDELASDSVSIASRIVLCRALDANWYPTYRQGYADYHREHPLLAGVVDPENEEDVLEEVRSGSVFEIHVDGRWAGMFIVKPASRDGVRGFVIKDELLGTEFRGRGLAAPAQCKLAEILVGSRRGVLFGAVSPANVRSLAAALSAGRRPISRCTFLRPH